MISIGEISGARYESDNREELRQFLWKLGGADPSLWCISEGETEVGDRKIYFYVVPWSHIVSDNGRDQSWEWMNAWSLKDAQKFGRVLNNGNIAPQNIGLLENGAFAARKTPPARNQKNARHSMISTPSKHNAPDFKILTDADILNMDSCKRYENGVFYLCYTTPNATEAHTTLEFKNPGFSKISFDVKVFEQEQCCWVSGSDLPTGVERRYSTHDVGNSHLLPEESRTITADITGITNCVVGVSQGIYVNAEISNIRLYN